MFLAKLLIPISHVKDLVAVRIMASPVGVGADPLKQFVISDSSDQIKTASSDGRIFMSTETAHIHWSIVQQQTRVAPCQGSNADWQSINVRFGDVCHRQSHLKRNKR